MKRLNVVICFFVAGMFAFVGLSTSAFGQKSKKELIDEWRPSFDFSSAKYKIKVSNITTPTDVASGAGFAIRDELWKRTNGQIYFEYLPFGILGGEVEVLNQLRSGAIQGMACNSHVAPNLGPRMGIVTLPFLINSYDKIDKFVSNKELFQPFLDGMEHQGIMGVDITNYGMYGWATAGPVENIEEVKSLKIRISEANVIALTYRSWGISPIVMPWPEVHVALKQGVINALDHTVNVCNTQKIFEITKNYTPVDYVPGLFIWIFNRTWFNSLPKELQQVFLEVIHEKCAEARQVKKEQVYQDNKIAKEKFGVVFHNLDDGVLKTLKERSKVVYGEYQDRIGKDYLEKVKKVMGSN